MVDYDAIIVGAGHNGLAAATVLAKQGLKVLVLEKNSYVGGMAATREVFKGFRHNVGAWALMVFKHEIAEALDLKKHGFEVITPNVSMCIFGEPDHKPFILYNDPDMLADHLLNDHGSDAAEAMAKLFEFCTVFQQAIDEIRYTHPKSLGMLIDSMPDVKSRDIMRKLAFVSVVDLINELFPDPTKHKSIQALLAGMAVDGMGLGPFSPGTAFSLAYHLAMPGVGNFYQLVKGGMGKVSEALKESLEEKGGEVKLSSPIRSILIENGKAVGVELRNGEKISAKVVLSSLDAYATFIGLVGEDNLPSDFVNMVKQIKYSNPYLEILVTLKELPEFVGDMAFANEKNIRWLMTYYSSPEYLERCYDDCKWGRIPKNPVSAYNIPSVFDDSLAPPGYHTASFFSQYFPISASRKEHNRLKEEMADKVIEEMARFAPNLKNAIMDRVVFAPMHYEKMFGVTEGDYSSGMQRPGQMFNFRPVAGWSGYKTPVEDLYLCGACCHPGPGVTAIPGYNSANEVLKSWDS